MENKEDGESEALLQVPGKITLDYIRTNKRTADNVWISFIIGHYADIISSFTNYDVPVACIELSETLQSFHQDNK